ncbi:uncharacterized protein LOC132742751 [Ruditapes philippinarum]|uniref:uncharacterized protein LOC132742751 n=1 Tax=Ruditapes philippinarum TaxID=129788 RepID=UPI00295AAEA0|nr:uncharacterized protein LOC132742751 [Ruditapes philippinarum]
MAVSGRKQSDLLGSIAAGSTEDFDYCCEPCLTTGQHVEAHGFCVTCQEYLCCNCLDCHKKAKISRSHQILRKDDFDKLQATQEPYNECTEHCSIHKKEIINFYCPSHHALGCKGCIHLDHRTCKIDNIPEKCTGIADDKDFDDVMQKLGEKLKEAEEISERAKRSSCDINDNNKEIIQAITEFRKDINDRLDRMQQDVLKDTEGIKSNNCRIVQMVLDKCGNIISDINSLQSRLHLSKAKHQNGQVYIDIKRSESVLKSDILNEAQESLMNTTIHYSFQRNADLETVLTKKRVFGEIVNPPGHEATKKTKYDDDLIVKEGINVQTKSDKTTSFITGCAVLNMNELVLADNENKKVKLVSIENRLVQKERALDTRPWDIAVMSQDQFAVTMPVIKNIVVMTTDDKLSYVRSIKVGRECYGIDFNQDCLYVACLSPPSVIVLNIKGDILYNFSLNFLTIGFAPYIAVSRDPKLMFISDSGHNSVMSVSLQGEVRVAYKHADLSGLCGLLMLDDRSLLVCCRCNDKIYQVKEDLKQVKIVHENIPDPYSICYNKHSGEVYVGCHGNQLKVLSKNDQ